MMVFTSLLITLQITLEQAEIQLAHLAVSIRHKAHIIRLKHLTRAGSVSLCGANQLRC